MSEKGFGEIADAAPAMLWVTDPDGVCTYLSRQWYEYTGQAPGAGLGFGWVDAVHPDDRDPSARIFLDANQRRQPFSLDYRLRRHDGVYRWAVDAGRPLFSETGEFRGFVGSVLDISDRKAVEDALRESESRYRRLVETAQEGVWIVDRTNRTTYVNERLAEMLGYRPEDILGRSPAEFAADEEARAATEQSLAARQQGTAAVRESRLRHRNGSEVWTLINANPLRTEQGDYEGTLAMVTDITAHKELERRLLQSQKMEAVGRLAGGVAHDFNNLLTAIAGHARLVLDELTEDGPLRADLLEIERAVERATILTRQLLTFSRREAFRPVVLDLNDLIVAFERMARRTIGTNIALEVELDESLPPIRADSVQMEQVLLNLVNNARDAMPNGGTLSIRTRRVVAKDATPSGDGSGTREQATLIVADTGNGMDDRTRERAFEPFFTTKPAGHGTGLGLATVHGIVQAAGGSIHVTSRPGNGTCFTIALPAAAGSIEPLETPPAVAVPRGSERILVVEDEVLVRQLAVRVLRRLGYQVVDADNAYQALEVLAEQGGVQLVLSDLVMPGMSGRELAERIARFSNPPRVMFMSGYSPDQSLRATAAAANVPFLEKPFSPGELGRAVREALDAPARGQPQEAPTAARRE